MSRRTRKRRGGWCNFTAARRWWSTRPPGRLTEAEIDRVYGLPFTRQPHPSYGDQPIPAFAVVKDSIQIVRGCFGGCAFCSIAVHEGRIVQSRSLLDLGRGPPPGRSARLLGHDQRSGRPDGEHVSA